VLELIKIYIWYIAHFVFDKVLVNNSRKVLNLTKTLWNYMWDLLIYNYTFLTLC